MSAAEPSAAPKTRAPLYRAEQALERARRHLFVAQVFCVLAIVLFVVFYFAQSSGGTCR